MVPCKNNDISAEPVVHTETFPALDALNVEIEPFAVTVSDAGAGDGILVESSV